MQTIVILRILFQMNEENRLNTAPIEQGQPNQQSNMPAQQGAVGSAQTPVQNVQNPPVRSPNANAQQVNQQAAPQTRKQKISRSHIPGYTLIRPLGKGGMATVYAATQDSFGREVAIKIMSPELIDKQDFAARFELEARMVAKLSHPNIVTVYDVGLAGQNYYLAMEIHPNGHLGQRIKEELSPENALTIAKQLADALHYAHKHSIVHRDLKPDNVLFNNRGEPVITDFGIARDNSADSNLTQVGSTVGTPKYMSPEQAKGEKVDGRSDIYGLGVIIYEMLTGEPPFTADDPVALAIKHCKEPIPRLPLMLEAYQPLIDKLMDKNRDNRPSDGLAVIKLIDDTLESIKNTEASHTVEPKAEETKQPAQAQEGEFKSIKKPEKKQQATKKEEKTLHYESEELVEGSFIFKKFYLNIEFSASDFEQFEAQFKKASKEIASWYKRYKKKAKQVDFEIEAHPWIHRRILAKLNQNFPDNHPFGAYANNGTVTMHLYDSVDEEGEKYIVRQNGKIPE